MRRAALLITVCACRVAWATTALMPVRGQNLSEPERAAIAELSARAYAKERRTQVLMPERTGPALSAASGDAVGAARALAADEALVLCAVRLQTNLTLSATLYGADGALLHEAELLLASLDDLPEASNRLARALVLRTTVAQARTRDNITEQETEAQNRVGLEGIHGVRLVVDQASAWGFRGYAPMVGLGYDGRLEGDRYFFEFGAGALIPGFRGDDAASIGGVFARLGGAYYLTDSSVAPYVGGGLEPKILLGDGGGVGLSPYLQAGVMFLRESSTRLYVEGQVAQNALPFRRYSGLTASGSERVYPTEFTLAVGLGF